MAEYVVLLMGQSNCWGQESRQGDVDPDLYDPSPANCFIWDKIASALPHSLTDTGSWVALTVGFGFQNPPGSDPTKIGCELQLADHLTRSYPSDTFYFIKCARGGTNLAAGTGVDWSPASTGELYDVWRDYYWTPAIEDIYLTGTPQLFGCAWIQGAADARDTTTANAFAVNLADLISNVRTDTGVAAAYFAIQRERNLVASSHPGLRAVRTAAITVAAADAAADWFNTDERIIDGHDNGPPDRPPISVDRHEFPSADGEHWDGIGQSHVGTAIARLFITRAASVTPPTIPDPSP